MTAHVLDPYESYLGYTPLPVQVPRNPDTVIYSLARILDEGGGKFAHYAVRYEEDGKPHLPTYGLSSPLKKALDEPVILGVTSAWALPC
jgi:hypothetical protein